MEKAGKMPDSFPSWTGVYSNEPSAPVAFNQHPALAPCCSCQSHPVSRNSVDVMNFSQKLYLGWPDYCQQKSFQFGYYVPCHVILECFPDFQKRQDCISHFSREPRYFLRGTLFKSYSWVLKCHFYRSSNWFPSLASLVLWTHLGSTGFSIRDYLSLIPSSHMQPIREFCWFFTSKICLKFSSSSPPPPSLLLLFLLFLLSLFLLLFFFQCYRLNPRFPHAKQLFYIKLHSQSPLPFALLTVSCQAHLTRLQPDFSPFIPTLLFLLKIQTLSFLYSSLIAITETP